MTPIKDWFKSLVSSELRNTSRSRKPPLVAYFWDGGCPVAHTVQNISHSGFFLETTERWLLGTLIMMTLQRTSGAPSLPDCSVIVMSKVVRYGEDGVGFAFIPVENTSPPPGQQLGPGSQAADRKTLDKFLELLDSDHGHAHFGYILLLFLLLLPVTHGIKEMVLIMAATLC
jgi:PilZ domain